MKAAIIIKAGNTPIYAEFRDPSAAEGEVRIAVSAATVGNLAKSRASGAHYSAAGQLPFMAAIDGVGHLDEGRRVYFALPRAPLGSMAEQTVVRSAQTVFLPDGLDEVTAAAIGNPGMSAWVALKERARLAAGVVVLVNGATGSAGRLAERPEIEATPFRVP